MTDSPQLSRRDWFRLRLIQKTDMTKTPSNSMGETQDGLQPIAHPENHDGMDLNELPPMREAILTREQVNELFNDIEQLATDILLMQRTTRDARATASKATSSTELHAAKEAFLSANVARLQIRYRWQDTAWIDTLESRPEGFRLVRISHSNAPQR